MNDRSMRWAIGLFVLAALVLMGVLIVMFGSLPTYFKRSNHYTIRFVDAPGVQFFQRMPNRAVVTTAMPIQKASVNRFLRQRMAKDVHRSFRLDTLINKFEAAQLAQLAHEVKLAAHSAQQPKGNLPADYCGSLKKLFCFLR